MMDFMYRNLDDLVFESGGHSTCPFIRIVGQSFEILFERKRAVGVEKIDAIEDLLTRLR